MKKLFFYLTISVVFSTFVFAQSNQKLLIKKFQYCELKYTNGRYMEYDNGVRKKGWGANYLSDINGRPLKFETSVDALNYMGETGWELVQMYVEKTGDAVSVVATHYMMKKEILVEERIIK